KLKDDTSYPFVLVDNTENYPRLKYVRKIPQKNGIKVFGPFTNGSNLRLVLSVLNKSFELRDCSLREFKSRKVPCLIYQLKQCSAPCVGLIDVDRYLSLLEIAINFLNGKTKYALSFLKKQMNELSDNENFEQAAIIRDNILVLDNFCAHTKQQNVQVVTSEKSIDIIAYYSSELLTSISVYTVRNGLLLGTRNFIINNSLEVDIITNICDLYLNHQYLIPDVIITNLDLGSRELVRQVTMELKNNILVKSSRRNHNKLYKSTLVHATECYRLNKIKIDNIQSGLETLQNILSIPNLPRVLECFDIAIWQGSSPTASRIVFIDGVAEKSRYRHYHLKELPEGNNDFEMMKEVITRRLTKGNLPDVFIVDGGKGQINIFAKKIKESGLSIPVVGIVKSKVKNSYSDSKVQKSVERILVPSIGVDLPLIDNRNLMKILVEMRDEAHRFSRKLHHKQEKKKLFQVD
ncbi:MAG: hypothetical protein HOJ35_08565, partial [Bdellovibrionales bacterium]|nr:hypothetical protein [Bdellovibrionales bacterium]